jgi:hypothetical protein
MEDRIQIGGVWYVREKTIPDLTKDVHFAKTAAYEDNEIYLLASWDDPEWLLIEFYDKVRNNEKDIWDNMLWINGVLDNNPESTTHIPIEYLDRVRGFLNVLKQNDILI